MAVNDIGVFQVKPPEVETVVAIVLAKAGLVFNLPEDIVDQRSFFQGIRQTLPLDPEVLGETSWDALGDSLWYGLHALNESNILIVWPKFGRFRKEDPRGYLIATELLSDLCASLADEALAVGRPKCLTVLQLLDGESR